MGHTPRAKNDSLPDVKVTIGAGHDLDDLGVIEPLPGEGPRTPTRDLPAAAAAAHTVHCRHYYLSTNGHLLPAEDKRITININSISARVPLLQQRASLLSRLNPRRIGSSTNKPTHRQVLDAGACASRYVWACDVDPCAS